MSNDHQIWPWYLFSHRMESELDRLSLCHKPMSKSFRELFQDLCMEDLEPEAPSWTTGNMNLGRTDLQSLEIKMPALRGRWLYHAIKRWLVVYGHPSISIPFRGNPNISWLCWHPDDIGEQRPSPNIGIPVCIPVYSPTLDGRHIWQSVGKFLIWQHSHVEDKLPLDTSLFFFFVLASGSGGFNRAVSDRDRSKLVEDGLF
jgi:hypothetical protein